MTIQEAVRKLAKTDTHYSILGKVKSIDTDAKTCIVAPVDDLPDILDVRLSSIENPDKGIIAVPVVNSFVIVGQTPNEQPHIVMFSEIDTYQLIAEDTITFNDGAHGGLIKIQDLVDKLNSLEDKVNDIITTAKTHTHPGVTAGGGVTAPSTDFAAINNLSNTNVSDIENDKILHG